MLSEEYMPQNGPGRVTSCKAEKDGSGSVSINLDLLYRGDHEGWHGRGGSWPADPPPLYRINGLRAVAADFSGKCGAPALIVLVDRIRGAGLGRRCQGG